MSEAFVCDSCGDTYEGTAPNVLDLDNTKDGVPVIGDPHVKPIEADLCGKCAKSIEKFINE